MPVEEEILTCQESCGTKFIQIVWVELIGVEHLADHFVVSDVGVQRIDDPIAPMPYVLLAVTQLIAEPPPVAVAPNVHPMAAPTLSVLWGPKQLIREALIPSVRIV